MFKSTGIFSQVIKLATLAEKQKQADTASQVDSFSEVDTTKAFPLDEMSSLIGTMKENVNKLPASNLNPQLKTLSTELSTATPEKMSQILSFSNIDPEGFKASEFPLDIETLSGLGGAVKGLNNNLDGGCKAVKSALNSSTSLSDFSVSTLDVESISKSVISSIQGVSSQAKVLAAESAAPLSSIASSLTGSLGSNPAQFSGGDIEGFLKKLDSDGKSAVSSLSSNIKSIASSIPGGFKSLADSASITSECCKDLADTAKTKVKGIDKQIQSIEEKVDIEPNNLFNTKKYLVTKTDSLNAYASEINAKIKEANSVGVAKAAAQNNPEAIPTTLESVVKNNAGKTNKQDDAKFKSKVEKSETSTKNAAPILKGLQAVDAKNESESLAAGRQQADKATVVAETKKYNAKQKIYTRADFEQLFKDAGLESIGSSQSQRIQQGLYEINKIPIPNMRRLAFESLKVNTKTLQRNDSGFWHGILYYPSKLSPYMDKQYYLQRKSTGEIDYEYGSKWSHYGCGFYFQLIEYNLKVWQHAPNSNGRFYRGNDKDIEVSIPTNKTQSDNQGSPAAAAATGDFKWVILEREQEEFNAAVKKAGGLDQYIKLNPDRPIPLPPETYIAYKGYHVNEAIAKKVEPYGFRSIRVKEGAAYFLEPSVLKDVDPLQYVNKNGNLNYDAVNELIGKSFL